MPIRFATPGLRRLPIAAALCVAALLVLASAASASTATVSGSTLTYTAADGDLNIVNVSYDGGTGTFTISDDGIASIDVTGTGGKCTAPDNTAPNVIECDNTVTAITANLGDQGDSFDASGDTATDRPVTVNGGTGDDDLTGGSSGDTLNGDDGDDSLNGGAGADTLNGAAGFDYFNDSTGTDVDTMNGGADNDYFNAGDATNGNDVLDGGDGRDEIDYSGRTAGITADLANHSGGQSGETDTLNNFEDIDGSSTGGNTLTGTDGPNRIQGGDGVDNLTGAGGDDTLSGYLSGDTLNGDAGFDELNGGAGADTLNGGDDPDYLIGGDGTDTLNGDGGDDEIDPGTNFSVATPAGDGADTVDGGAGSDWIDYYDRTAPVTVDLSGGGDGSVATTSNGQSGEHDSIKNIENVNGGTGADTITGNSAGNTVYDGSGAGDNISTLGGDDEIDARDGAVDTANCGDGNDRAYVDVAGEFNGNVSDNVSGCEAINSDYTPPPVDNNPPTQNPPTNPITTTPGPVTTPAPVVITPGAFMAAKQQSPKADTVTGTASIPADGSGLTVLLTFNGKLAKVNVVGKLTKTGLKKGVYPFKVKLNKKAAKLARKKGKKGLKLTVKVTIKPPAGSATVKTFKVTVIKGKAPACYRIARAHAHTAC